MAAGRERFAHLDVPQLLKHALGLAARALKDGHGWQLRYIYLDAPSGAPCATARAEHARELSRFQDAVGEELRFRAVTYQALIAALGPAQDASEAAYFQYVRDRYLGDAGVVT